MISSLLALLLVAACAGGKGGHTSTPADTGCSTWYTDADGDGYGDPATAVTDCTQPSGTVAQGDDCDDTDALAHPGAYEWCDGHDDDCNGTVDDCGPTDLDADVVAYQLAAGPYPGTSVQVGDWTGDGVADLVIGAPGRGTTDGAVYLLAGPLSARIQLDGRQPWITGGGVSSTLDKRWDGAWVVPVQADEGQGLLVSALDGAALFVDPPPVGPLDLRDATAGISQLSRYSYPDYLGGEPMLYGPAGDIDGDGTMDVVLGVAQYGYDWNGYNWGDSSTFVIYGPITGRMDIHDAVHIQGGWIGREDLHEYVSVTGFDENGDGFDDLAIGGEANNTVHLFTGPTIQDGRTGDAPVYITRDDDYFGVRIKSVGDVNEDGYDDLLISGYDSWYLVEGPAAMGENHVEDLAGFRIDSGTAGCGSIEGVSVADENRDGELNYAVWTEGYTCERAGVYLLQGPLSGVVSLDEREPVMQRMAGSPLTYSATFQFADLDGDDLGDLVWGVSWPSFSSSVTSSVDAYGLDHASIEGGAAYVLYNSTFNPAP